MAGHTPGPWQVDRRKGNHDEGDYPEVMGFRVSTWLYHNAPNVVEANARLIAKAPELKNVAGRADTTYQNIAVYLRDLAESDRYAADLLVQVEDAGDEARALLAEIDGAEGKGEA